MEYLGVRHINSESTGIRAILRAFVIYNNALVDCNLRIVIL